EDAILDTKSNFLGCQPNDNLPAIIEYQAVAGDNTLYLKSGGSDNDCVIDWGDDSTSACPNGNTTHNYASASVYTITISGDRFAGFSSCDFSHTDRGIKRVISMGKWSNDITDMSNAFNYCRILAEVSPNAFKYLTKVTDFSDTFTRANITSIPADLFRHNTEVESFYRVFSYNPLTSIPANLFRYNTKVKNFNGTFEGTALTSVPADLFMYNTEVESFSFLFSNVVSLRCSDIEAAAVNWPSWNGGGYRSTDGCKAD
ncbi:MAG: hypothetical protein LBG48_02145, partial [Rickettsiales bacterium]|nr:hypothetical protein [Rickettsiales bacterium]